MRSIFESLRPAIRWVALHPVRVLLIAILLSAAGGWSASKLKIDTDLAELIPEDYPAYQALEKLRQTVGGESDAAIGIVSPSFEANRAFAEAIMPQVLALKGEGYSEPYFGRVDYRRDITFLQDNALYFATEAELDDLEEWLDTKIEDARYEANPFFFDLEEEDDVEPVDSLADELKEAYDQIVAKEYPVSDDSTTLSLRFYPTGSQTNLRFVRNAYKDLAQLLEGVDETEYHPDMKVVLSGRLERQVVEVDAIQKDVAGSFLVGVATLLLMVVLYFATKSYRARAGRRLIWRVLGQEILRLPVMVLVIGLPLFMSLAWTFGIAQLAYGSLNMMTSTLGLILFGLGIDFGIHFYAHYAEERGHGLNVVDAVESTFVDNGQAITTSGLTTSLAMFVLMVADFKGFSQFGFIAGTGIILALVAMLVVLPALVALFERTRVLDLESVVPTSRPDVASAPIRWSRPIVAISFILVAFAIGSSSRVEFEYDFGKLEPTYADYDARRNIVRKAYNDATKRNPAYVIVDDADEIPAVVEALRLRMEADTLSPTILSVESLYERFPLTPQQQAARLARLEHVRGLLADPFLATDTSEDLEKLRRSASTAAPIPIEHVPDFLKRQFTDKDGALGRFVIIYPSVGLSDGLQSIAFSEDVGTIETADGATYHAGSSSLVAAEMLKLMQKESPWMVLATMAIVIILMLTNFTAVRWAALALVPLVVGLLWMLLAVELFGLKLNFYNMIVLPSILGIGDDVGVHIVHRYRELGPKSIRTVLRTTGEHVTMSSLTTMVGFAGLVLSFHPGLESIGWLAITGILATLAAGLVFLPALIQWLEDRGALKF